MKSTGYSKNKRVNRLLYQKFLGKINSYLLSRKSTNLITEGHHNVHCLGQGRKISKLATDIAYQLTSTNDWKLK